MHVEGFRILDLNKWIENNVVVPPSWKTWLAPCMSQDLIMAWYTQKNGLAGARSRWHHVHIVGGCAQHILDTSALDVNTETKTCFYFFLTKCFTNCKVNLPLKVAPLFEMRVENMVIKSWGIKFPKTVLNLNRKIHSCRKWFKSSIVFSQKKVLLMFAHGSLKNSMLLSLSRGTSHMKYLIFIRILTVQSIGKERMEKGGGCKFNWVCEVCKRKRSKNQQCK